MVGIVTKVVNKFGLSLDIAIKVANKSGLVLNIAMNGFNKSELAVYAATELPIRLGWHYI